MLSKSLNCCFHAGVQMQLGNCDRMRVHDGARPAAGELQAARGCVREVLCGGLPILPHVNNLTRSATQIDPGRAPSRPHSPLVESYHPPSHPPPHFPCPFVRSWLLLQPVNGRTSAVYGIAPFFFLSFFCLRVLETCE